jgi:nucleotidyltransferase substrate binding protein (TIGR01987 family)
MLDLSSLGKCVSSLQRALRYYDRRMESANEVSSDEREILISAIVQNFEFTYEMCWKFMRRWLEINLGIGTTAGATRKQIFRLAFESLLILDVDSWFVFHELRNLTSHTYDMEVAMEICSGAAGFAVEAAALLEALEKRND